MRRLDYGGAEAGLACPAVLARGWLGTPYQHGASLKGAGCDCLGLVRGVWRERHGAEPETPPPYRPDWAEVLDGEPLLDALGRWLAPVPPEQAGVGDVLAFRMAEGAAAKHLAILSVGRMGGGRVPEPRIIHAYWGRAVVESWLQPWWRRRVVGAWRWPAG